MSVHPEEFDNLASLWAEEPSFEQRTEFRSLAEQISLRATILEYADLAIGIAIAAGVFVALALRPAPVTLAVGLVAAAGLLWSSWRRHLLRRQIASLLVVSDRTDLLDLQIRQVTTALQRSLIGVVAVVPVYLLFAMLTHSIQSGGTLAGFGSTLLMAMTEMPVGLAIAAAMLTLIVQQVITAQRLRLELRRLQMLAGQYREEARLDRIALG